MCEFSRVIQMFDLRTGEKVCLKKVHPYFQNFGAYKCAYFVTTMSLSD